MAKQRWLPKDQDANLETDHPELGVKHAWPQALGHWRGQSPDRAGTPSGAVAADADSAPVPAMSGITPWPRQPAGAAVQMRFGGPGIGLGADQFRAYDRAFLNGIYVGAPTDSRELHLQLLRRLAGLRTRSMPLRGTRDGASPHPISRLYIPLAIESGGTLTFDPKGSRPGATARADGHEPAAEQGRADRLDVCQVIARQPALVVLGGPGAGKTSLLVFLAQAFLAGEHGVLPDWPRDRWPELPLYLRLRDLAAWMGRLGSDTTDSCPPGAGLIWGFLRHDLAERNLSFCQGVLEQMVRAGVVQFLWDGLDEVPPSLRATVRTSLLAFHAAASGCRVVITARALSYELPGVRLPEAQFPVVSLRPFDRTQIDRFIGDWFWELADSGDLPIAEAQRLAVLCRAGLDSGRLRRCAGNPLLLTLLALVFTARRDLPETPAKVYEAAIEVLLLRLDGAPTSDLRRLDDLLREARRDRCDLIRLYERLAVQAQGRSDRQVDSLAGLAVSFGRIGEGELIGALQGLHPGQQSDWAQSVLDLIKSRPGLLREDGPDEFDFIHRSLREYLAGCHFAHTPDFGAKVARAVRENAAWWRESALHAVGFLIHCQREWARPLDLIERLCPADAAVDDSHWRRVWLAGEVAAELGATRAEETEAGVRALERVRHRLAALVEAGALATGERAAAAAVLGRLGDPRFNSQGLRLPTRYRGAREPALGLVRIRRGRLQMSGNADLAEALPNEFSGERDLDLHYGYWVGRYPITVEEFRVFLGAGGYQRRDLWSAAGWDSLEARRRREPKAWKQQCRQTNRPVVGINWFEASAFAAWLDAQLRKHGEPLPAGCIIRLPTEAEWAFAARGAAGRAYPWGEGFSAERANCRGGPGRPTAVGLYPLGATPDGVHDMAGNVWEWTLSLDRPYPYDPYDGRNDPQTLGARILRGGSWNAAPSRGRTGARTGAAMHESALDVGFRLVLSVAEWAT